jgi:hypothetical protein
MSTSVLASAFNMRSLRPAVFRPRFTMHDTMTTAQVIVVTPANIPPYLDRRFGNTRQEAAIDRAS